jgi:hypothetical protein
VLPFLRKQTVLCGAPYILNLGLPYYTNGTPMFNINQVGFHDTDVGNCRWLLVRVTSILLERPISFASYHADGLSRWARLRAVSQDMATSVMHLATLQPCIHRNSASLSRRLVRKCMHSLTIKGFESMNVPHRCLYGYWESMSQWCR